MRESWMNLNGEWQFETDNDNDGRERELFADGVRLSGSINVPFCPESRLSGVECTDFMNSVWYKRSFTLDAEHLGGRVILHFGAADYRTTVYVNGRECGSHRGGYVSFSFDITDFVSAGANTVTVNVTDDTRDRLIPSGKQSGRRESFGCYYTRTTGIWQTVWLEFAPQSRIVGVKYFAQPENALLTVCAKLEGEGTLRAQAFYEGRFVGDASVRALVGNAVLTLALSEKHLWEIGEGRLYDLILTFGDDSVKSYFGLRSVGFDGHRFLLNGKSVFQRLVLDQGFYPDGIYTAPSDGELAADVERAAAMGFNGARLHEKVFE